MESNRDTVSEVTYPRQAPKSLSEAIDAACDRCAQFKLAVADVRTHYDGPRPRQVLDYLTSALEVADDVLQGMPIGRSPRRSSESTTEEKSHAVNQ